MVTKAPGKLILSGEHSVVYGAPALALAVDNYVTVTAYPNRQFDSQEIVTEHYPVSTRAVTDLPKLVADLDKRYEAFLSGDLAISALLDTPTSLLHYCLSQYSIDPLNVSISSELPPGSGMGSSAAVIAALLLLASAREGRTLTASALFEQVRYCERLQHGRGSAIDAAAVTYGGIVELNPEGVTSHALQLGPGWYHYQTGVPECSTGEVVAYVRAQAFAESVWQNFADVTQQLLVSLKQERSESSDLMPLLRENHRLLQGIGVVPDSIAKVVSSIEACGGAAKLCGAGAHKGEKAGQMLVYLPDFEPAEISARLGIELTPVRVAERGVHLVED